MPSDTSIIRLSRSYPFAVGKLPLDLDFLPKDYRIDAVFVELDGTLNVPVAGTTSDQLRRLLDSVQSERRLNSDGVGVDGYAWHQAGREWQRVANIAQNAAAPANLSWLLNWRDERGVEAGDAPPATNFYAGKTLDLYFKDPATILAGLAVNAGTAVQVTFHLSKWTGSIPASTIFSFMEYTGKDTKLPAGQYVDLFIRKLDGTAITDAELGNVVISEDGTWNVCERTRLRQFLRSFNRNVAAGAQVAAAGVPGEAIDEASAIMVPLLHPRRKFKGTKLPTAVRNLWLTIDGNLAVGTARIYFRILELRDEANVERAANRLGLPVPPGFGAQPKTASKNGVSRARGFLSGMAARIGRVSK
jgi:hypothetical protein